MILQALCNYYQRLVADGEEGLAPFGYSSEKISYEIVLGTDGRLVRVNDVRDTSAKKPAPKSMNVPQPEKRTVGIKSNFLWDKTSYVLGVSATSKRTDKEHDAFKTFHQKSLGKNGDAGLKALLQFLDAWTPEQFVEPHFSSGMLDTNFVFRLDGEFCHLHNRPAAQALCARVLGSDDAAALIADCLVTGQRLPMARLHPPIKGVNGAQSSGASVVSFNLDSFTSYGKSQGANAPISEQAAFAYTTVLNHLLRRGEHNRQRIQIGDATVVFWAEAEQRDEAQAAETLLADMWTENAATDSQESAAVRHALEVVAQGRPLREADRRLSEGTRMYVLGLAPNASRISIRFWHTQTLGSLARNLAHHAQDIHIEPARWKVQPSLWRLVLATAPSRGGRSQSEDVSPQLAGELMRAILEDSLYPASLLANVIMRMRTDGDLSDVRVAICKATLARAQRLGINHHQEEVPVSLDKESNNPAYRLGRLFAVLETAQRNALGGQVNATIRDRYYGAASATPASVFPMLLRNTQNHLGKLRKEKRGLAINLEKDIREIVDGLPDHFPRSLRIEDQGRFAIGYYHQSQARFAKASEVPETDGEVESNQEELEEVKP